MERVLASPVMIATAIAAKTHTMRIGTAVYCLPLGHPIRVAEEMATLDHISDGRVELGVGTGNLPQRPRGFQRNLRGKPQPVSTSSLRSSSDGLD